MKFLHDRRELQFFAIPGFFLGFAIDLISTNMAGMCLMGMAIACQVIAMFIRE